MTRPNNLCPRQRAKKNLSELGGCDRLVIITSIAMVGKIFGVFMAKPFVKDLSSKQLHIIGWAMNSRGTVELVIALIAFKVRFIDINIYSAIVLMTLITTMMFPFILKAMLKKEPGIMD